MEDTTTITVYYTKFKVNSHYDFNADPKLIFFPISYCT